MSPEPFLGTTIGPRASNENLLLAPVAHKKDLFNDDDVALISKRIWLHIEREIVISEDKMHLIVKNALMDVLYGKSADICGKTARLFKVMKIYLEKTI